MLRGLVVMWLAIESEIPSTNLGSDKHFLLYFYYFLLGNASHYYFFYLEMLLLYVKMAVLYEYVKNFIILETLKVLFTNILLKKKSDKTRLKKWPKGWLLSWFRHAKRFID